MTFGDLWRTVWTSPGRFFSSSQETWVPAVGRRKRRRNDSDDCLEEQPQHARPRTQQPAEAAGGAIRQAAHNHAAALQPGLGRPGRAPRYQGRKIPALPQAALSTPGVHAAYDTGRYGAHWAAAAPAAPVSAARGPLTLYKSIASQPRRHGPTSSFRAASQATPPVSPQSLVRQLMHACHLAARCVHACRACRLPG